MTDIAEEKTTLNTENTETGPEDAQAVTDTVLEAQIKAAAMAYAKYLKDNDLAPGDATFAEPEELGVDFDALEAEAEAAGLDFDMEEPPAEEEPVQEAITTEEPEAESEPTEVQAEVEEAAEAPAEETEPAEEETPAEAAGESIEDEAPAEEQEAETEPAEEPAEKAGNEPEETPAEEPEKPKAPSKAQKAREKRIRAYKKSFLKKQKKDPLSAVTDLHDKVQDAIDGAFRYVGRDIVKGAHRIASTYRNSRRGIGAALLLAGILAAAVLIIFDKFTVYEYAYNGKVLGYVQEQEEVTDVLDVAGRKLSGNTSSEVPVEFVANQNVTFNLVDGRGKSTDDSDTAINKLLYMTDIETEAYAVYDGDNVVAIVKDSSDAEALLNQTKAELSVPDPGMQLVSSDFINKLDARPVNVLLGSVQSNDVARNQMVNGGEMATYHIVEEGETAESIAEQFGADVLDIYDETNSGNVTEIEQGDRVCIRNVVEPVKVEMVETGKLKETVEFETIKKETDKYYKGDTYLEQEGSDGVQIFEGTITKVAGEVTDRDEVSIEVIKEKKDKIILVGTAERPKTAATGTFQMPIEHYVVTSEWGGRWGRMHEGMDFGAPTGTSIYASDGGKIIRAGWFSGHGLCVEIDHGNNVVTRYSHCSRVLVNVGDLVYQGQEIAKVGNTGHSFGSHLHFEVRVNGSSQNPRKYVNP
jgi:murein DD-endopeptidase MepM/ murein hydrolase activator NlpD